MDRAIDIKARLGMEATPLSIVFVEERMFGGGFIGRGVCGKGHRALVMLEFVAHERGTLLTPMPEDAEGATAGEDPILPHELMHIKDVVDGRSPSLYPFCRDDEGEWIDLFRHLWIDGHLEQLGFPHSKQDRRLEELVKASTMRGVNVSAGDLKAIVDNHWGKPVTLRQAVELGLGLGFALKPDCPMGRWFSSKPALQQTR